MKLTLTSAGGWHPIVWIEQKGGGSKNLFSLLGLVHFFLLSSDIGVPSSSAFGLGWNYFPGSPPCEQQAVGMLSLHNCVNQFLELISLPLSLCVSVSVSVSPSDFPPLTWVYRRWFGSCRVPNLQNLLHAELRWSGSSNNRKKKSAQ